MRRGMAAGALLALAAGCTLAEVVIPESEDVLVVEAVLRTDVAVQTILLHRTVRDGASALEQGAVVRVRTADGSVVRFEQGPTNCTDAFGGWPLVVRASCYLSPEEAGEWVRPGGEYLLEVTTARGEEARGRTVVPGAFELRGLPFAARAGEEPRPCAVPPATQLPVRWTPSTGAWGYVAPLRLRGLREALPPELEAPDPLELLGLAVSAADTEILLPAEFGLFDRFSLDQPLLRALQAGLPPGTRAEVTVAAADRNYINGVRGGSFNPSGRVRISSVTGDAVGVFGSLVPLRAVVEAGPPAEGRPACAAG